jgi:hypothetical protein
MIKEKKFDEGDLVRFIDIHTTIDVLPPTGFRDVKGWDRFIDEGQFDAKRNDVGVVIVSHRKHSNITYAQILVSGELFWFDVDNLEKL